MAPTCLCKYLVEPYTLRCIMATCLEGIVLRTVHTVQIVLQCAGTL